MAGEAGSVPVEPVAPGVTMKAHNLLVAKVAEFEKRISTQTDLIADLLTRISTLEATAARAEALMARLQPKPGAAPGWNPFS